ncbi:MAG: HAMP domain-containing histidine kinase [Thermoanaerobaculia bacterium]|nr:HAMP domain-containing histidine kinase [Thermoanaerobaculia bacterium]
MDQVLPPFRPNVVRYAAGMTAATALILLFWPGLMSTLFSSGGFMPHAVCYLQNPRLIWVNAATDLLIGVSYVVISALLTLLVHRARRDIPFTWVFLAFGTFIVACGMTHFMEVMTIWQPVYWLSAAVKIVTAVASVATAAVLPPMIPKVLAMVREAKQSRERLAAFERERAARYEAEEASRAKDTFLATLSHELRTPLTAVIGWTSMIRGGELTPEAIATGMQAIDQSARAQAQLIDDLLDVSRIVAGKLSLEFYPTDPGAVIRAAVETVRISAAKKEQKLEIVLPPAPVQMVADPSRLNQVMTNLLSNAVKFTPAGGRVRVELTSNDSEVQIAVSDDGIGIGAAFIANAFDRFSQADSSVTRLFGGLGLGLAIVRHIVELHGGSVSVKSEGDGKGTTFTVRLPLSQTM